jgi:glycosyltransferase involved in cell wall biosynthesis
MGFRGVIHFMWAERDWGFLDRVSANNPELALCATFHCCPDTFSEVIKAPKRLLAFSAIILMSEVQRPFFLLHGVPDHRIHVVPHGIDSQFFSPVCDNCNDRFVVLFVGNYRRNFELLGRVCTLLEPHEDVEIRIIAPRERVAKFTGRKNVKTSADVDDADLRAAYQGASCLLMTLEAATANNAILEAMACGLPIVAERIGGVAEYTGSDCAQLCEPGSAEGLANAVLALYRDRERRSRMGIAARRRAEEFDWPVIGRRTMEVYEQALAGRPVQAE